MRRRRALALVLAPLAIGALCASAFADRVLTKDGRILAPKKARAEGAGYRFVFANGEIVVADKSLVQSVEIEGDMSEYVPANDDERKKLADGYVKYRGRWLSKPAFEEELRKEFEKSKARTEELAKHSDWDHAYAKETQHFVVKTNTSPELRDYYAELLEAYYALMDERIGIEPTPTLRRTKMAVNVYKSYEEFQQFGDPGGPSVLGFFSQWKKSLNLYHDYQEPSLSTWVALHECTHLLTFLVDPQYQPQIWLNEAVADYLGSSRVERDKKDKLTIKPGEIQTDRILTVQQAIQNGAVAPPSSGGTAGKDGKDGKPGFVNPFRDDRPATKLDDLFLLSHDDFDGFQYAHAWSFVYFLNNFENGKYAKNFWKFFKSLYTLEKGLEVEVQNYRYPNDEVFTGKLVSAAHIKAFLLKKLAIKDTIQIEKDWRTFIAGIPIAGPEARLKRGLFSIQQLDFPSALEDLTAAIEGGTKDPRAWGARGRALAFTGKPKEAIEDLKKAVGMDPLDAAFRYELSRLLANRITLSGRGPSGGITLVDDDAEKIDNAEAKLQSGLAMEMEPDNDRYKEWFARFQ